MANRKEQLSFSRSRVRQQQRRRLILIGGALAALILVVAIVLIASGGKKNPDLLTDAAVQSAPTAVEETVEPETTPEPTPAPMTEAQQLAEQRAKTRPTPMAEGHSPIFVNAKTKEKIVAITVDDCFQASNLEQIVNKALEVGGKLTIFPIGKNVLKKEQARILKYAWEHGFELENHTFTHNGLYKCSDAEMAEEIYKQQLALSYILGVEYQPHFLRPMGGDARRDQRMQQYAMQLGYYGIAHWSVSGSASNSEIAKGLKPGAIYLFHTTNKDLTKLLEFIPWVVSKGYKLVTLNEMFGYPENETSALTVPISQHTIPTPQPFKVVYLPLKNRTFSYYALLLQEKLIDLGYLKGKADGVYGKDCENAVKLYQQDHGLKVTGIADPDLLETLLGT